MYYPGALLVIVLLSPPDVLGNLYGVEYSFRKMCVPAGSVVDIPCKYTYPTQDTVQEAFWFVKWENRKEEFIDLRQRPDYKYRSEYLGNKDHDCTLRIKDLRKTDSIPKYKFRFITDAGKFSGEELTLQVVVPPKVFQQKERGSVTLTCTSTCPPNSNPSYIWYRNRQPVDPKQASGTTLVISPVSKDDGHYSCALKGHEDQPSPPECVSSCWSVTYTHQKICAVESSSVDIKCYYSYPSGNVRTLLWYFNSKELDFTNENGHVEYLGNKNNDCSLRIKGLRTEDTGQYYFKFITTYGRFNGKPEVSLSLTGLQVIMTPETVTEGQSVTFTCSTSCSLSGNPTYIWYKNSKPTRQISMAKLNLGPVSTNHSGNYSCAVKGHETHPSPAVTLSVRYVPRNVSVSQSISGIILEGSSVMLTCSSDANPPVHKYTWFKMEMAKSIQSQIGLGPKYNISNITSQCRGHYYCNAQNSAGARNSLAFLLDVHYYPKNTYTLVSPSGDIVEGDSVTLTCSSDANPPVHNYTWYKINREKVKILLGSGQNHSITNISSDDMGQYYCAVTNTVGSSSSALLHLNVYYPAKDTSVMVNPSGESSSVTLTCSSDANPPVHNYTWYKKIGNDSVLMATGTSGNIPVVPVEGVLYYCVVHNKYGSHISSEIKVIFQKTSVSAGQFAVLGIVPVMALVMVLVFVIRRKKGEPTRETSGTVDHAQQDNPNPIYEHVSAVPLTSVQEQRVGTSGTVEHPQQEGPSPMNKNTSLICDQEQIVDTGGDEDDVQYASVQFKTKKKDRAPESTAMEQTQVQEEMEKKEGEDVQYTSVKFRAPAINQDEDNDAIYSNIKKPTK